MYRTAKIDDSISLAMNADRSSTVSSSLSVVLSRQGGGSTNPNQVCSSQSKTFKSPINQFYCNLCFSPLINPQNLNRASFVTSCGHFYCEQCAQTSKISSITFTSNPCLSSSISRPYANVQTLSMFIKFNLYGSTKGRRKISS